MSHSRGENGTAIVEFAIVFPVMLLIVLAIIQISLMFTARQVVEYAAFAAARAELVREDPHRAASLICSSIAGPAYTPGSGEAITVPGWGALPRGEWASAKTFVKVIDPVSDGNGVVTVEVTHYYQLIIPFASLIFKPISRPLEPGDEPEGLFVTVNGVPHFVLKSTYTRPVPWDIERQNVQPHPLISGL